MLSKTSRSIMMLGAVAQLSIAIPMATPAANAQSWEDRRDRDGDRWSRERRRDEWDRRDSNRRDRERRRRNDAKTDGIVAGVVGTAVVAGIIAAATSGGRKEKRYDEREAYCRDRYGNYDRERDSYRADDGRYYRCE